MCWCKPFRLGTLRKLLKVERRLTQGYGPQKYFAVPPVCCLLRRCMRAHQITARQLVWVSRFVRQYGLLQIILNSFLLWARLTLKPREAEATEQLASVVLKISGVLAVYGLFVMYKATHDLLDDWNTTRGLPLDRAVPLGCLSSLWASLPRWEQNVRRVCVVHWRPAQVHLTYGAHLKVYRHMIIRNLEIQGVRWVTI